MTPSAQSSFKARIAKEMSCTKGNNALPGSGLPGSGLHSKILRSQKHLRRKDLLRRELGSESVKT